MVPKDCTAKFNGIKGKVMHVPNNNPNYNPRAPKAAPRPPRALQAAAPTLPLAGSPSSLASIPRTSLSGSPFTSFPLYWPPLFGPPILQDVHLLGLLHQWGLPLCGPLNRFLPLTPSFHPHSWGRYTCLTFHAFADSHAFGDLFTSSATCTFSCSHTLNGTPTPFHPPTIFWPRTLF